MQKEEQKPVDEIVISDTCCLISFEKINKLDILDSLYKNIYITPEVLGEYEKGGSKKPSFIKIKEVKNRDKIEDLRKIGLHEGEASSIALYNECENPLLLTDDGDAREYADKNNLKFLTTLDILVEARELGYIKTDEELHKYLDGLLATKRWMPVNIINEIKEEYKTDSLLEKDTIFTKGQLDKKAEELKTREAAIKLAEDKLKEDREHFVTKQTEILNIIKPREEKVVKRETDLNGNIKKK